MGDTHEQGDGAPVIVSEIFGPTIQGEGPSTGRRAVFVRTGRCNLNCSWCDTPYTWDWTRFDPAALDRIEAPFVARKVVELLGDYSGVVVITGGEPMIQREELDALVDALDDFPLVDLIEVETNGTRVPSPFLAPPGRCNVSPKLSGSGCDPGARYNPDAIDALVLLDTVFKFVVMSEQDVREVDGLVRAHLIPPELVWLMPCGTSVDQLALSQLNVAERALERGFNYSHRVHVVLWGDERGH